MSKIKSAVFNYALSSKMKGVQAGYVTKNSIWDYIIFKKVGAHFTVAPLSSLTSDRINPLNFPQTSLPKWFSPK